jgi:hypothetical protein
VPSNNPVEPSQATAAAPPAQTTVTIPAQAPEPKLPATGQAAVIDNSNALKLLGWTKEEDRVPENLVSKIQLFVKNAPPKGTLLITGYCDGSSNANAKSIAIARGSNARNVAINGGYPITKIRVRYITFAKQDGVTLEWKQ